MREGEREGDRGTVGGRDRGRERGREGWWEGEREGGTEGEREGGREGERERGTIGGREGEGGRDRRREGGRTEGGNKSLVTVKECVSGIRQHMSDCVQKCQGRMFRVCVRNAIYLRNHTVHGKIMLCFHTPCPITAARISSQELCTHTSTRNSGM